MTNRVLVFAPHHDDGIIGADGTVIRHTGIGDEVRVGIVTAPDDHLFPTDLRPRLRREAAASIPAWGLRAASSWSCRWESYIGVTPCMALSSQIQAIRSDGVVVQCGDRGHLLLESVESEGCPEAPAPEHLAKVHECLGRDWLNLYEELREGHGMET